MQLDREDESTPLLLSASQHSTEEQQQEGRLSASQHSTEERQQEGRESNPRATFYLPRVEDESMQPFFSGLMHSGIDKQHEHSPSSHSTSGEFSPISISALETILLLTPSRNRSRYNSTVTVVS